MLLTPTFPTYPCHTSWSGRSPSTQSTRAPTSCTPALPSVSSGNNLKLKDDCQIIRPTLFISVPRIYNRIVDAIKTKFANETGVKKWLIDRAVNAKTYYAKDQGLYKHSIYDPIIFSKVRETFGGRIRVMASGSAPMNPEAIAFLKTIMCCPFIEGYGQTENAAGAILSRAFDTDYGSLVEIGVTEPTFRQEWKSS